jgi:molybdate transport system substrate-binding protein
VSSRPAALVLAVAAAVAVAGCGADGSASPAGAGGGGKETGSLTVLAAASLTEPFGSLARTFESEHAGVQVRLSFDSSATLAEQVLQGAPADVLATADEATMRAVVDADGVEGEPQVLATNHLVLAVPKGNPGRIRSLSDLENPDVTYVVCVGSAPCGKLAATVLEASDINAEPVSEEVDVKAVLSKVELDEVDAGLVYASDAVAGHDKVESIDVPASTENLTTYPIAALTDADKPRLATEWVDLVTGERGRKVLAAAGFGAP